MSAKQISVTWNSSSWISVGIIYFICVERSNRCYGMVYCKWWIIFEGLLQSKRIWMDLVFPTSSYRFRLSSKFNINENSISTQILFYFGSKSILFCFQDYVTYWTHRFYHLPFFYKHIHKWHHYYKQPTPFSATATHPIEAVHFQLVLVSPMVFLPVHWSNRNYF